MNSTITVRTGHSDDGGFDWARMESRTLTERELWNLGEQLYDIGALKRLSGYEIVSAYVTDRLGMQFTVEQLNALIADAERIIAEGEERRRLGLVKCACGHTVAKRTVMSTSRGTSCPDCYDRMSD